MKKTLFTLLFAMIANIGIMQATIYNGSCGDNLTWSLNTEDSTLTITGSGEITSYPWAYYNTSYIKYVSLPNGLTSIGEYAFKDCSNLKSIILPNSVRTIGNRAFKNCTGLISITIPNSVTSMGHEAFADCSGLTSVTIQNGITSIGTQNFYHCTSLTAIEIPNSVKSIGYDAFCLCTGLASVSLGNSVTSIGEDAFFGCTSLTAIEIPNSVKSIEYSAFSECKNLTSVIIGEGVERIARDVFRSTALTSVVWKAKNCASSGEIGESPFYYVSGGITSFTFGDEVISIPKWLCLDMSRLTSMTIPNSVRNIGLSAFRNCTGLASVSLGNSVENIESSAFQNCNGLTSLDIPNSVISIGEDAFYGCSRLTMLDIPNSVTTIGGSAFSHCSDLYSVTIGEGVQNMGTNCFSNSNPVRMKWNAINCADFSSRFYDKYSGKFTFGDKVEHIPAYLFAGMTLDKITLPASVTSIGVHAFDGISGTIIVEATTPPSCFITSFPLTTPIYVPTESFNTYKADDIWGEFNILPMDAYEAIDEVQFRDDKITKCIENGQIFILRGDKVYTLQGQEVK